MPHPTTESGSGPHQSAADVIQLLQRGIPQHHLARAVALVGDGDIQPQDIEQVLLQRGYVLIAAAVPMATAAVPIIAWCSLPIDNARTSRSISLAATVLPLEDW